MRVTVKDCEIRIKRINDHIEGDFYISRAYGGFSLHKRHSNSSVTDVLGCGHIPAKDLYNRMNAFIIGLSK